MPLPEPLRLSLGEPGAPGRQKTGPQETEPQDIEPQDIEPQDIVPQDIVLGILRLARALDHVDAGLSPQQYRILKLAGAGGERSARLAERLAVAKPTLTAIADGLVAAGLARREAEPGDRRVVRLHLTDAGVAAVERADAAYGQWLAQILDLTGHGEQIHADLRLMVGALDELRRRKKAAASTRTGDTTTTEISTARPAAPPNPADPANPAAPPNPAAPNAPAMTPLPGAGRP